MSKIQLPPKQRGKQPQPLRELTLQQGTAFEPAKGEPCSVGPLRLDSPHSPREDTSAKLLGQERKLEHHHI